MFLFGLRPRFCVLVFFLAFCFAVSAGETQVWLGDLRVVAFCVVVVSLFWFNRFADFKDFVSLYRVLAAYSHVRTELLGHTRGKKKSLELLAARGLLAPDTWKCKRAQVSLKATIDRGMATPH